MGKKVGANTSAMTGTPTSAPRTDVRIARRNSPPMLALPPPRTAPGDINAQLLSTALYSISGTAIVASALVYQGDYRELPNICDSTIQRSAL